MASPLAFKGRAGFTLIEVLVSTVLLGLMGALLMSTVSLSGKAKDTVEEISGRYQIARQAMSRMAREISMAYLSKNMSLPEPAYVTQFKGMKSSLYFSAFGNVVHQKDAKQSDQQVLGFYLGVDRDGHQSLMRRHRPGLNMDVEKGGHAQVLCPNVSKLEFQYYDDQMDKWEEEWNSDPTIFVAQGLMESGSGSRSREDREGQRNLPKTWRLPTLVKISMTVDMGGMEEVTWISQTAIPIQEPLDLN